MKLISLAFLIFVAVTAGIYYLLPRRPRPYWLLASSLFFYACADIRYFAFIGFSAVSAFLAALAFEKRGKRNKFLPATVVFLNVAVLAAVKFLPYSLNLIVSRFGASTLNVSIIVPLGIAFYTMQAVSYCVDVKRGKYAAERNFFKFLLYMTYFPIIMQGPISRYDQLAPQLFEAHSFDHERVKNGILLAVWGFFKKLVIADRAALIVNQVFGDHLSYPGAALVLAVLLYALQIYADFSGCVDICRGVSQIYGIELIENFDHPYFSTSIKDFWQRWHISLSSWLRDYVYFPLGGGRKGRLKKYLNVLMVFVVSGLWHGVGVHYLVWGLLHGFYRVIGDVSLSLRTKIYGALKLNTSAWLFKLGQMTVTFALVCFAWLFFRAENMTQAIQIVKMAAVDLSPIKLSNGVWLTLGLDMKDWIVLASSSFVMFIVSVLQCRVPLRGYVCRMPLVCRWALYLIGILSIVVFGIYGPGYNESQFVYMQF